MMPVPDTCDEFACPNRDFCDEFLCEDDLCPLIDGHYYDDNVPLDKILRGD